MILSLKEGKKGEGRGFMEVCNADKRRLVGVHIIKYVIEGDN